MRALIIDTETTGINEPALVEYGQMQVFFEPRSIITADVQVSRFNPGKPIEFGAMATHGITDEDVAAEAPASEFVFETGAGYIIGHQVDYDWRVIGEPPVKRICTLALARKVWPSLDSHRLMALMFMIDRKWAKELHPVAHGVAADIVATSVVLERIIDVLLPASLDDLWRMSEAARVPEVMPFGKHKGVRIDALPADYTRWLLNQPDIDPYLRQALTGGKAAA